MTKVLAASALGASLVMAQVLPAPLSTWTMGAEQPASTELAFGAESDDSVQLTLEHKGAQTSYTSFSDALAAAEDGDTIVLNADAHITSGIKTDKALTLDLQGHTLSADLGASRLSGAISYGGTGTFELTSSAAGGALQVTLGSARETSGSAGSYRAISMTGTGTFALDGASVQVTYTGASTASNLPTPALYGIVASSGTVSLEHGASVTATASEADGAYGANTVAGIYATSSSASAKVSVSSDSSVKAINNAKCVSRGSWQVPDLTSTTTTFDESADLVQIFPDENSEFYKEICDKFKKKAKLDDSEEASVTSSSSTDTEVYYAAPLTLDSGVSVWAYSEPKDTNTRGDLDGIVPKYFFVQSDYVMPTSAYGIGSTDSFAGSVTVSGQVNASCANGDAYALDALGNSTWTSDSFAKLTETHGTADNRVEYGLLNLEKYFDPSSTRNIAALGSTSSRVIYDATPAGGQAFVGSSTKVTLDGATQVPTDTNVDLAGNGIHVDDAKAAELWAAPQVSVSFSNVRNAGGTASESTPDQKAAFGKSLSSSGITLPTTAPSYTQDGTTYRFVGWRCGSSVYDAGELQNDILINSDINNASKGQASFEAVYLAVKSNQYLVRFLIDGRVIAYAADAGSTPSYEDATGNSDAPDKIATEAGYDYEFEGWQQNGTTLKTLPAVTGDADYTATFKASKQSEELAFRYRDTSGNWTTTSGITADYGSDTNEVARNYAKAGDVIKTSEKVYTFTGWGPRVTDQTALYADGELPTVLDTDSFTRQKNTYYAKYTIADRMLNVSFVVDGKTVGKTSEAVKTSTDFNDVLDSCDVSTPKDKSKKLKFLGWSAKKNAKTVDVAKTNAAQLSVVAPAKSDDLKLYAVFGKQASSSSSGVTRSDIKVKLDSKAKRELDVDASKASITAENLDNAKNLTLSIKAVGNADDVVRSNAIRLGYEPLLDSGKNKAVYETRLTYTLNGKKQEVYDGFGTIRVTAKVPKGARSDKVRAYWLGSAGINYSAAEQNTSNISFDIKSLGYVDDGVGNLEIAVKSASKATFAPVTPATAKPTVAKPSVVAPSVPKPSAAAKVPKASKPPAKATAPAATKTDSASPDANANSSTDDSSESNDTATTSDQNGNIVGFAAILALIAALIARVAWFFVKRHKGDDEEAEADPMPDQETVSF